MKLSNRWLNKQFKIFNEKYFGGKLENVHVRFKRMKPMGMTIGMEIGDYSDHKIFINGRFRDSNALCKQTLLHEMVHVENPTWHGHGYHFDRRMLKLAKDGAFNGFW